MKKVLIIGVRGMLGGYLAQVFRGNNLTLWSSEQLDITDHVQARRKIVRLQPDIVINAAAYNSVDNAEYDSESADRVNGYAVGNLAQLACELGFVFVHYSTEYVFAGEKRNGYKEKDQPCPCNKYGCSKYLGEKLILGLAQSVGGLRYYIIRTSRLFGKPAADPGAKESFVRKMLRLAATGTAIQGVDEELSRPTYALDLACRTRDILVWRKPAGIYHVTNSGECTWYEFAREIFAIKKLSVELIPVSASAFPARAAQHPRFSCLLNTKLPPLRSWREALREFLLSKSPPASFTQL